MTDPSFEPLSFFVMLHLRILNLRNNIAFRATDTASASPKATALRGTNCCNGRRGRREGHVINKSKKKRKSSLVNFHVIAT